MCSSISLLACASWARSHTSCKKLSIQTPACKGLTIDMTDIYLASIKKKAKIRNEYNQVPHLTRGTIWESYPKNQGNVTHKRAKRSALSQQVIRRQQGTERTYMFSTFQAFFQELLLLWTESFWIKDNLPVIWKEAVINIVVSPVFSCFHFNSFSREIIFIREKHQFSKLFLE